jgi:hypothetical protein
VALAINTDPEAPMVARADCAIIGDLHAIIPLVAQQIFATIGEIRRQGASVVRLLFGAWGARGARSVAAAAAGAPVRRG